MTPRLWTIPRAEGVGTLAGLCALLLWPVFAAGEGAKPVFAAALALTALCGVSILLATLADLARRRRGRSLRPVRSFDVAAGLLLAGPALLALAELF